MHIKIIRPQLDGTKVYNNKGSVSASIEYLKHEKEESGEELLLFDHSNDAISPEKATQMIDENGQGLGKKQTKFYSIIISPSSVELDHIENNQDRLKAYSREVMKGYASNFNWKDGRKIGENDLVWVAAIHQERRIKPLDLKQGELLTGKEKQAFVNGSQEAKSKILEQARERDLRRLDPLRYEVGQRKEGNNMHVHIIVSAKDRDKVNLLNPQTLKSKFHIQAFQHRGGQTFQQMFGYQNSTTSKKFYETYSETQRERLNSRVAERVEKINAAVGKTVLGKDQMIAVGEKYNYNKAFFVNLGKILGNYKKGHNLRDPEFFAQNGRDRKPSEPNNGPELQKIEIDDKQGGNAQDIAGLSAVIRSARSQNAIKETFLLENERKALKKWKDKGKGKDNVELD